MKMTGTTGYITMWVLLSTMAPLFGQSGQGGIRGTVTDTTGALVPEADVRSTNVATGVVTSTVSSSAGLYYIPITRAGTYRIEASKAGFKRVVRDNIVVALSATVGVDLTL